MDVLCAVGRSELSSKWFVYSLRLKERELWNSNRFTWKNAPKSQHFARLDPGAQKSCLDTPWGCWDHHLCLLAAGAHLWHSRLASECPEPDLPVVVMSLPTPTPFIHPKMANVWYWTLIKWERKHFSRDGIEKRKIRCHNKKTVNCQIKYDVRPNCVCTCNLGMCDK